MIANDAEIYGSRHVLTITLLAALATLFIALWPARSAAVFATIIGLAVFTVVAGKSFPTLLFTIFFTVAWFPEASQTKDVYTAAEAPSIYNYRPIPALYASVFDYLFAAVVLAWLVSVMSSLRGRRDLFRAPLVRSMSAFFAVSLFSLVYGMFRGGDLYYAMREFRVSAYFVLVYLMVVTTMRSDKLQHRFAQLVLGAAFLIGVYGVIRSALGMGKEFNDIRILYYDIGDSIVLFTGLFVIASAALAGYIRGAVPAWKAAALAAPMLFSFIFSYRRGAWVAFLAALVFLLFFSPAESKLRRKIPVRFLAVLAVVAVAFGFLLLRTSILQSVIVRFSSISNLTDDTSNLFRVFDALNAFYTFLHHPILGTGYGGRYEFVFYSTLVAPAEFWDSVSRTCHNGYLYILYKMGLVGFSCYAAIFVGFFVQWFKSRPKLTDVFQRTMCGAFGASVFAIQTNNMTSTMTDSIRPALVLAFVMGFAMLLFEGQKEKNLSVPMPERGYGPPGRHE
jgi:O-antigen ligase